MRRILAVLALLAALGASTALADATPVQLLLVYMPNVSNTDTPSAAGIAELVMLEGEVRIEATNLPHLDGPKQYVAWVVNSDSNQFQRLGAFNTSDATNSVHFETVLPDAIPNKKWNLLLVTIEDSAQPAKPGAKHSIAGAFPGAQEDPLPAVLPNTGGAPDDAFDGIERARPYRSDWLPLAGLATLVTSGAGVAGYRLGKRRTR